jgi:hypothetical protein
MEKGLLRQHDHHLQRLDTTQMRTPPIGWYIDYVLPAMNGDLDVERERWSKVQGIEPLIAQINAVIAGTAAK